MSRGSLACLCTATALASMSTTPTWRLQLVQWQQVSLVVDCQALAQGFEPTAQARASYNTEFAGF
jgi:hypothetical protein